MERPPSRPSRFGTFEADPATGELRKSGRSIRIQEQPFRLLILLLERSGGIVTREELQEKLWGPTHVDFEEGLNTAVRKLRDALGDSASNPRFIETLPRRGYRFIAPIQVEAVEEPKPETFTEPPRRSLRGILFAGGILLLGVTVFLARLWLNREQPLWTPTPPVQATRDSGLTTDPAISRDGLLLAYASDRGNSGNLEIWLQHVSGGEARRLTNDPADDHAPDISPDGSEVIFRSERDGGGIYSIPTNGGTPRLILKSAYVPRFSPEGTRIAYGVGHFGSGAFVGNLHVLTRASGATRQMAPGLLVGGQAAWSPDGRFLAFAGSKAYLAPLELWICPADGGPANSVGALPNVNTIMLVGHAEPVSTAWFDDQIILSSASQGGNSNLWTGRIAPESRRLTGELKRITLGSGNEVLPSVSANGTLVFANHNHASNIREATLDKTGLAKGMRRLTQDNALNFRPSVSADGSKLAFISDRTGNSDLWIKDLLTGKEMALTRAAKKKIFAAISRDGNQVAYWDGNAVYLASVSDGASRLLCKKCGRPDGWTRDGKVILSPGLDAEGIRSCDPITGEITKIASHKIRHTTAPAMSPDGNWITFHTAERMEIYHPRPPSVENEASAQPKLESKRQIFVAPYTGQWIPQESWIAVTDGTALDREARWSADGNQIYFLSDRDGFRCIWVRKLDPRTKQPAGSMYPVMHSHHHGQSLLLIPNTGNVSISPVGGNKLIFAMGELTGNLWLTQMRRQ